MGKSKQELADEATEKALKLSITAAEAEKVAYNLRKEAKKERLKLRQEEEERRIADAKARLFDEHDVIYNPKRELLWSHAWELGHDAGIREVEYYFSELAELIK